MLTNVFSSISTEYFYGSVPFSRISHTSQWFIFVHRHIIISSFYLYLQLIGFSVINVFFFIILLKFYPFKMVVLLNIQFLHFVSSCNLLFTFVIFLWYSHSFLYIFFPNHVFFSHSYQFYQLQTHLIYRFVPFHFFTYLCMFFF